ncbi:MAG: hypothetical protein ACRDJ4_10165 [Actinomycetota bacterium]
MRSKITHAVVVALVVGLFALSTTTAEAFVIFGGTGINGTNQRGYRMSGITMYALDCLEWETPAHWSATIDFKTVGELPKNGKVRVQFNWGDGSKTPSTGWQAWDVSLRLTATGREWHQYPAARSYDWTHPCLSG